MKKLFLSLLIFVLLASLILWIQGKDMREIRTEIDIAAPPAKVWSLLTDIEGWHKWSPIINKSSGNAAMGSTLDITMIGNMKDVEKGTELGDGQVKDGPQYNPKITIFEAPKHFRWRAQMMAGFIMTNDKVFELEETTTGTHLVHSETFSGLMVPLFWGKVKQNVPDMLNSMNSALKTMAETE